MTKTELFSTYTAEQLAEMVVELQEKDNQSQRIYEALQEDYEKIYKEYQNMGKERNYVLDGKEFADKIEELQSEVEKYRKAFEDAKKERDCQIAEYRKKIEELTYENKSGYVSLQQDPIDIASDLIKAICWQGKEYLPLECMQLRQIAEHLLVCCNHHGKVEEQYAISNHFSNNSLL